MHILSANQRKAISSMGMESSFLQIRRNVEQPKLGLDWHSFECEVLVFEILRKQSIRIGLGETM